MSFRFGKPSKNFKVATRLTVTCDSALVKKVKFWASKRKLSQSDFCKDAVIAMIENIEKENGDEK